MNNSRKLTRVNIRATADPDFWGSEFPQSLYLSEGAKHNLSLSEMADLSVPTMADMFASEDAIQKGHDHCRDRYFKLLPGLAAAFNRIHRRDLPVSFWATVFGFWLIRHISIVYEKFTCLSQLDIDNTDLILLAPESTYIPDDHYDYMRSFCNDFGVQQIVSLYYRCYAQKRFPQLAKSCGILHEKQERYTHINLVVADSLQESLEMKARKTCPCNGPRVPEEIRVALCCAYYTPGVLRLLAEKSAGRIREIDLPTVFPVARETAADKRAQFLDIPCEDEFDRFLVRTLPSCTPKILVEYFSDYFDAFAEDLRQTHFTHIVSEVWRSFMPVSIYLAVARLHGKKLILQQHGASTQWRRTHLEWLEHHIADAFLTTGWEDTNPKIVRGGWALREMCPHALDRKRSTILYISSTSPKYLYEISGVKVNSRFIAYLNRIRDFMGLVPPSLRDHLVLRPRRDSGICWDTELALETASLPCRIDQEVSTESYTDILSRARIVVIDHLSTGVAEVLGNDIPCLILHDPLLDPLSEEHTGAFYADLVGCGVIHNSPDSAAQYLEAIYDRVEEWWKSASVRSALGKVLRHNIAPPSQTVDYLLSCLEDGRPGNEEPRPRPPYVEDTPLRCPV